MTSVRRTTAAGILVALAILAAVVLTAQFDPGRFVYIQPLRGAAVVCALIYAIPVVAAGAALLGTQGRQRAEVLRLCLVLAIVAIVAASFAYVPLMMAIDDEKDHRASVVAASSGGTYEVVVATRRGNSSDYQILRARSRDGVFSRDSAYPLAIICDELVAVRFTGPDELQIVTRSFGGPRVQTQVQVRIDRQTLRPGQQFSSCTGDLT